MTFRFVSHVDVVKFAVCWLWQELVLLDEIQSWVTNFEPVLQSLNMSYIGILPTSCVCNEFCSTIDAQVGGTRVAR